MYIVNIHINIAKWLNKISHEKIGPDLVHDEVEQALLNEIETVRHTQALYKDALSKFEAQVSTIEHVKILF